MIICTVDYGNYGDVTAMLTDTTYSGGFARIDVDHDASVSYLVRYNDGKKEAETFDGDVYSVKEAVEQAVYAIADVLAFNATNNDIDYDIAYNAVRLALGTELHIF